MQPFRVEIPQADLDDLRRRLAAVRWPVGLPEAGWDRGVPPDYLRDLVRYWQTEYDWRAIETRLNRFPQYRDEIDGVGVHYLHVRSPEPDATPMLVTHGWPGSFLEFEEIIGPLTDPRAHGGDPADAFHLVIPAIPGFGFSGPHGLPGWTVQRTAAAWAELMERLGYDHYVAQGADFGAAVSMVLAHARPEQVSALHLNMLVILPSGEPGELDGLTEEEQHRLTLLDRFVAEFSGSMKLQSTRPHTIAYPLADSPVGQLAWIVEKFKDWAQAPNVPEDAVDRDVLLTIASIYWFTNTAGSSAQFYFDNLPFLPKAGVTGRLNPISQPLGIAVYPGALFKPIRRFVDRDFPTLVHWREHDRGGHFAALEEPDLFVEDLQAFGRQLKKP
ncbi:epoxide hydrolase family protein [Catenulispora rubra]|uniref:epoxide hydrolase family protein n=1 Tax=Catenulispora rubra TaxID=280293 RepID=UPI001892304D|nr:epoxide hydrolase family protein [Catenulispora rubra]